MLTDPKNVRDFILQLESIEKISHNWNRSAKCAFEDIVRDISYIKAQAPQQDVSWLLNIFNPPRVRSLFPDKVNIKTPAEKGCSIYITVISANNVQQRDNLPKLDHVPFLTSPPTIRRISNVGSSFRLNHGDEYDLVDKQINATKSFVRIRFQDQIFYTRVDIGDRPTWEQRFEIPILEKERDNPSISPAMLKAIEDDIEIVLFDKIDVDYGQEGGFYDDENTLIQERRFLGKIKIPLEKICTQNRVEGHYLLQTPRVVLGYLSQEFMVPFPDNSGNQGENVESIDQEAQRIDTTMTRRSCTTLNMLITMEPDVAFAPNQTLSNDMPSNEVPRVVKYAQDWLEGIFKTIEISINRQMYDILVPGSNGKTWLLNRFLNTQSPPDSCKLSIHRCAHFVSLLPRLDNWSSFKTLKRSQSLWLSSQKFLNILAGNSSEHAALLANYFLYLNDNGTETTKLDVFLVMGRTISESKVVSVSVELMREKVP